MLGGRKLCSPDQHPLPLTLATGPVTSSRKITLSSFIGPTFCVRKAPPYPYFQEWVHDPDLAKENILGRG